MATTGYYLDRKGKEKLSQQLRQLSLKGRKTLEVKFGYRAAYAVYVHENPFAFHPVGKWHYLSDPLKRGRAQMGKIAAQELRRKRSLEDAVAAMLEYLREKSQEEVPIDTGFLHDSWFVRLA